MTEYTTGYRNSGIRPSGAHLSDGRPADDRPREVQPTGGQSPDDELMRVREDIELRCRELGATIEELAARADLRARTRHMAKDVRAAITGKRLIAVSAAGGLLLAAAVAVAARARARGGRRATRPRIAVPPPRGAVSAFRRRPFGG
ncbi:MAG: hypothetical protein M0026_09255 [Nocardiopsaceae bacterium]|nr:hypothetical protein [Nocardiopsaceae bacterium]